jgi:hypothetical protein
MAGQYMVKLGFLLVFLGLWVGCGKNESAKPRTRDVIFLEIQSLPALYLTGKTKKRVKAPGGRGSFVDEKTDEICWPAKECGNPNCPGRGSDDLPFIFITPDSAVFLKPDGTFGYDEKKMNIKDGMCPECLTKRILKTESNADRNKYAKWVKPHVLPESAERKEELEVELEKTSN